VLDAISHPRATSRRGASRLSYSLLTQGYCREGATGTRERSSWDSVRVATYAGSRYWWRRSRSGSSMPHTRAIPQRFQHAQLFLQTQGYCREGATGTRKRSSWDSVWIDTLAGAKYCSLKARGGRPSPRTVATARRGLGRRSQL
jgi:hypothetical protein